VNPLTLLKEGQADERAAFDALLVAAEMAMTTAAGTTTLRSASVRFMPPT